MSGASEPDPVVPVDDGPDGPMRAFLECLAGWSLPGAPPLPPLPSEPTTAAHGVREAVTAARLLAPFLLAAETGAVQVPDALLEEAADWHRRTLLWCLHLERRLLAVEEWFDVAGGVEHVVIKGPAIAHLDELDPSMRSFADVDLLVSESDLDRAVEVLLAHGGTRRWAPRRPGYDRRFAKSVTVLMPDRVEVDLHRSLTDGVHGFRIPLSRLFAEATTFELGGRPVPALSRRHRVLHAAYHAVLGSPAPALMNLRDLAGYLTDPAIAVDDVTEEARRWRGDAVLADAVRTTATVLRLPLPRWDRWLAALPSSAREEAIIERQRREGSALGVGKLQAMRELPGLRLRAAYALGLAYPSREHLRSRRLRRRDMFGRAR